MQQDLSLHPSKPLSNARERIANWADAYKLRSKRRLLLGRAFRKRKQLTEVKNRATRLAPDDILLFATVRNEHLRLPYFLAHYRRLGVQHFFFISNNSTDGTSDFLAKQEDVSLWTTMHSYKLSRFGMDWVTWLQIKYAHGHWCLTLDADEIFIYPFYETSPLKALTDWLDTHDVASFGALMLNLYPKGRLQTNIYTAGQNPFEILNWFDSGNYFIKRQLKLQNLWVQGGVRARCFFANSPPRSPTLSKVPLVKWNRRFSYLSSTHSLLPRKLNHVYGETGGEKPSGVLLHTKFLHLAVEGAAEEKLRREHFENIDLYQTYYDRLTKNPSLWCQTSSKYTGWRQLDTLGLMSKGAWI